MSTRKSILSMMLVISLVFVSSFSHGMSLSMMLDHKTSDGLVSNDTKSAMPCHQLQPDDEQQNQQSSKCLQCHFCIASGSVVIENTVATLTTQRVQARYAMSTPLNLKVQHYPPAIRPPII